jgi:hypothetical protein
VRMFMLVQTQCLGEKDCSSYVVKTWLCGQPLHRISLTTATNALGVF